MSSQIPHIYI